jgi:hypothetical protein
MIESTSGPWSYVSPSRTTESHRSACIEVSTADYAVPICHVYERKKHHGKYHRLPVIANAKLIAAAPELYEALKSLHHTMLSFLMDDHPAMIRAKKALEVVEK